MPIYKIDPKRLEGYLNTLGRRRETLLRRDHVGLNSTDIQEYLKKTFPRLKEWPKKSSHRHPFDYTEKNLDDYFELDDEEIKELLQYRRTAANYDGGVTLRELGPFIAYIHQESLVYKPIDISATRKPHEDIENYFGTTLSPLERIGYQEAKNIRDLGGLIHSSFNPPQPSEVRQLLGGNLLPLAQAIQKNIKRGEQGAESNNILFTSIKPDIQALIEKQVAVKEAGTANASNSTQLTIEDAQQSLQKIQQDINLKLKAALDNDAQYWETQPYSEDNGEDWTFEVDPHYDNLVPFLKHPSVTQHLIPKNVTLRFNNGTVIKGQGDNIPNAPFEPTRYPGMLTSLLSNKLPEICKDVTQRASHALNTSIPGFSNQVDKKLLQDRYSDDAPRLCFLAQLNNFKKLFQHNPINPNEIIELFSRLDTTSSTEELNQAHKEYLDIIDKKISQLNTSIPGFNKQVDQELLQDPYSDYAPRLCALAQLVAQQPFPWVPNPNELAKTLNDNLKQGKQGAQSNISLIASLRGKLSALPTASDTTIALTEAAYKESIAQERYLQQFNGLIAEHMQESEEGEFIQQYANKLMERETRGQDSNTGAQVQLNAQYKTYYVKLNDLITSLNKFKTDNNIEGQLTKENIEVFQKWQLIQLIASTTTQLGEMAQPFSTSSLEGRFIETKMNELLKDIHSNIEDAACESKVEEKCQSALTKFSDLIKYLNEFKTKNKENSNLVDTTSNRLTPKGFEEFRIDELIASTFNQLGEMAQPFSASSPEGRFIETKMNELLKDIYSNIKDAACESKVEEKCQSALTKLSDLIKSLNEFKTQNKENSNLVDTTSNRLTAKGFEEFRIVRIDELIASTINQLGEMAQPFSTSSPEGDMIIEKSNALINEIISDLVNTDDDCKSKVEEKCQSSIKQFSDLIEFIASYKDKNGDNPELVTKTDTSVASCSSSIFSPVTTLQLTKDGVKACGNAFKLNQKATQLNLAAAQSAGVVESALEQPVINTNTKPKSSSTEAGAVEGAGFGIR